MCQFGIKTAGVYIFFFSPCFFVSFLLSFSDLVQETGILHQFYFVISFPYFYCCSLYVCCRDVVVVAVVCHELAIYSKTTSETINPGYS